MWIGYFFHWIPVDALGSWIGDGFLCGWDCLESVDDWTSNSLSHHITGFAEEGGSSVDTLVKVVQQLRLYMMEDSAALTYFLMGPLAMYKKKKKCTSLLAEVLQNLWIQVLLRITKNMWIHLLLTEKRPDTQAHSLSLWSLFLTPMLPLIISILFS